MPKCMPRMSDAKALSLHFYVGSSPTVFTLYVYVYVDIPVGSVLPETAL